MIEIYFTLKWSLNQQYWGYHLVAYGGLLPQQYVFLPMLIHRYLWFTDKRSKGYQFKAWLITAKIAPPLFLNSGCVYNRHFKMGRSLSQKSRGFPISRRSREPLVLVMNVAYLGTWWLTPVCNRLIWGNYNDLTATSLWSYFRLVNYFNLPRIRGYSSHNLVCNWTQSVQYPRPPPDFCWSRFIMPGHVCSTSMLIIIAKVV